MLKKLLNQAVLEVSLETQGPCSSSRALKAALMKVLISSLGESPAVVTECSSHGLTISDDEKDNQKSTLNHRTAERLIQALEAELVGA
jgi:hypothetical protein